MGKYILYKGQSLFEIVMAIGISALILVAIVSLSTRSVSNSDFSAKNAQATKFAQQGMEWIRQERDSDWDIFYGRVSASPINIGDLTWGSTASIPGATGFTRTVLLEVDLTDNDKINATVYVTWTDSRGTHTVTNISTLTRWNR